MKKDYIENFKEGERRFFNTIDARDEGDGSNTIHGIASEVEKEYDMGWYTEKVAKGAFDANLEDDVRALFNHDPNLPLARTTNGSLKLRTDEKGNLTYSFKVPDTQFARDLHTNIKSGLVNQSSFAFQIESQEWIEANSENGLEKDLRVINKFHKLYDVSPVTYPASPSTTVAARSHESLEKEEVNNNEYKRRMFNIKYK